jgi:hypothetical protein
MPRVLGRVVLIVGLLTSGRTQAKAARFGAKEGALLSLDDVSLHPNYKLPPATVSRDACQQKLDAWCSEPANCSPRDCDKQAMYAVIDGGKSAADDRQWRCYANSTTDPTHTRYVGGSCYCTRNKPLTDLLCKCDPTKCLATATAQNSLEAETIAPPHAPITPAPLTAPPLTPQPPPAPLAPTPQSSAKSPLGGCPTLKWPALRKFTVKNEKGTSFEFDITALVSQALDCEVIIAGVSGGVGPAVMWKHAPEKHFERFGFNNSVQDRSLKVANLDLFANWMALMVRGAIPSSFSLV